jgi:hypothetical protein
MEFPAEPYQYRDDEPHVGPARPLSQGDVFVNIPLLGPAQPHPKQAGTWVAPKPRTGPKALGLFVTHPCASRSQTTSQLARVVSIAPVVKCPDRWGPPWDGYFSYVPLPGLRDGQNYVAKLNEVCSVPTEALAGQRIACLNEHGLKALFHRLAMNALRFPETPLHYQTEAERLTYEINLWERWTEHFGVEDGFQDWLDEPFGGQPREDAEGNTIPGSQQPSGKSRREVLVWNYEEVNEELSTRLAES